MHPSRRRNPHQEEAARDRLVVRWVFLVLGVLGLCGVLVLVMLRQAS